MSEPKTNFRVLEKNFKEQERLDEVKKLAEDFQKECDTAVAKIIAINPEFRNQDVKNVWIYMKLAELQLELNELKSKQP